MGGPHLIIGAPVHERGWVLRHWFEHLADQGLPWDKVEIVLNYGESSDDTMEIIREAKSMRPWVITVLYDEGDDHSAKRNWGPARYQTMVRLRNDLLAYVRRQEPTLYFSLDTDILLPPGAIQTLIREAREGGFQGIAPMMYMTPHGTSAPNAMQRKDGEDQYYRVAVTHEDTRWYDAVFAGVLMNQDLYRDADYAVHRQGEDLGWALNVQAAGHRLALCASVKAKHIMRPWMLEGQDSRIGW